MTNEELFKLTEILKTENDSLKAYRQYMDAKTTGLRISRKYDREMFCHMWPFVYLHGDIELEETDGSIDPDMFYANMKLPECEGDYKAKLKIDIDGEVYFPRVIIKLKQFKGAIGLRGRGAYMIDTKAIEHINKPAEWM